MLISCFNAGDNMLNFPLDINLGNNKVEYFFISLQIDYYI